MLSYDDIIAVAQSRRENIIDVYPQVIIDASKVLLNRVQLDYLSHHGQLTSRSLSLIHRDNLCLCHLGPNYIRPNQSYLYPYERDRNKSNNSMRI